MKTKNRAQLIAVSAALALAVGCAPSESEARGRRGQDVTGSAEQGMFSRHQEMLEKAITRLKLRPDQEAAVRSLARELKAKAAPMHKLKAQAARELAQAVRAGKLDPARTQKVAAQVQQTMQSLKPELQAALNKLHAILDQSQRQELVEMIKERRHRHGLGQGGFGKGPGRSHGRRLLSKLELTDAQKDQLHDAMYDQFRKNRAETRERFKSIRAQMKAAAEAFVSDRFDARQLDIFTRNTDLPGRIGSRLSQVSEAVLPLLNDGQRQKLATLLEAVADRMDRVE